MGNFITIESKIFYGFILSIGRRFYRSPILYRVRWLKLLWKRQIREHDLYNVLRIDGSNFRGLVADVQGRFICVQAFRVYNVVLS